MQDLTTAMMATLRLCPTLIENEDRLGAITDFTFNLGAGRLKVSTLRKRINQSAYDEVPAQLLKWVYGGGRKLRGLALRRQAEAAYF
jgi:lysozyme